MKNDEAPPWAAGQSENNQAKKNSGIVWEMRWAVARLERVCPPFRSGFTADLAGFWGMWVSVASVVG